jgi:hypothetical protein
VIVPVQRPPEEAVIATTSYIRRRVLLPVVALGGVWWWAVLRLAFVPEHTGFVEGAVAAGGWGLSLLPVHVASRASAQTETARKAARRPGPDVEAGPS